VSNSLLDHVAENTHHKTQIFIAKTSRNTRS